MGLFDSVISGLMGGNTGASPLGPIVADLLGGQSANSQGNGQPGIAGLIERFAQAGHGDAANSWVGNGSNQPIEPGALQHVFGQDQIAQWVQQTGMAPHDLLSQLAQMLPTAINAMTPNGQVQQRPEPQAGTGSDSPFDGPGMP
jgi:uncharacterized protein YidB (DUF937 family)